MLKKRSEKLGVIHILKKAGRAGLKLRGQLKEGMKMCLKVTGRTSQKAGS